MATRSIGGASTATASSVPSSGNSGTYIGGSLNFAGGGGDMFSGGLEGLAASYSSAYNAALSANQSNYNNILAGYQSLAGTQYQNQQNITQGYTNLTNDVLSGLTGSNAADLQSINDQYTAQMGKTQQGLTSAGLNNTTVTSALQRGINLDQAKATTNSNDEYAKLIAGYQSNLGLAGLDYLNQANVQQVGLGTNQLDFMNSVQIPYPDAGAYAQLAASYGQQAQQGEYMDWLKSSMSPSTPQSMGGGFSGVYGTQPTPTYASSGYAGGTVQGTNPGSGASATNVSYSGGSGGYKVPSTYYDTYPSQGYSNDWYGSAEGYA